MATAAANTRWRGRSARARASSACSSRPATPAPPIDAENVDIPATDVPRLLEFAQQNKIDLTVVGPEAALAAGLVDAFQDAGLRAFGPSRAAAELETSKVFCKNLLRHADVPTADYRVFRDAKAAITLSEGPRRHAGRREGRRPGRRQGRHRLRQSRASARGGRADRRRRRNSARPAINS